MRDTKQIKINLDEATKARQLERIKKSLQRFEEKAKECGHTPAEQKFLNKLTVGVCAIAALIVFAAYHLLPKIN